MQNIVKSERNPLVPQALEFGPFSAQLCAVECVCFVCSDCVWAVWQAGHASFYLQSGRNDEGVHEVDIYSTNRVKGKF